MRLRLLSEDFVAFRDSEGRVGIVDPRCPHRGANLFFGRNEECGLRCIYHGWKFDVEGNCVDTPNVSEDVARNLRPKASIRALQVREWGDVVWAYLGAGDAPELPQFEFATVPESHRFVSKKLQQCNWAQACEGGLDTAHFSYLHAGVRDGAKVGLHEVRGSRFPRTEGDNEPPSIARYRWLVEDGVPEFTVLQHDAGLVLGASRRADDDQLYWRITQFLMPNHSLAPGNFPENTNLGNTWVPIDDESCWIFCYAWRPDRPLTDRERDAYAGGAAIFAAVDEHYVPLRNRDNDYLIDRTLQREASYTGITGISEQDAAVQDSQGLIADRTRELLCQTDLGVVRFRQMMLDAVKDVSAGDVPHGANAPEAYNVRSGDQMAPASAELPNVLEARFEGASWVAAMNGRRA
ncbi:MAG: Rieske 2Fe-2S domain-containing protein [Gammaproteobacteria bacterium]